MKDLTVIVPFLNEEKFLKESVNRLLDIDLDLRIILYNDSSTDESKEIAIELTERYKNIDYFENKYQRGKGDTIARASKFVETKFVAIHDADLEYFPEDLVEMYEKITQNQESLILGSRLIGSKKRENIYTRTLIANRAMSYFFSLVHFYKISDIATCYKMMPTQFLKNINVSEKGFAVEVEILSKYLKYKKSVIEVPIKYSGRSYEDGKKIKTSDGIEYIIKTLKYRFFD
ncbi:glycosyltransferase family 2 protein [Acidimicrobiaceae bacterium]|nr:glycosyltransferase family 2 protein [Acidimicrobiaceae bacterium]